MIHPLLKVEICRGPVGISLTHGQHHIWHMSINNVNIFTYFLLLVLSPVLCHFEYLFSIFNKLYYYIKHIVVLHYL